MPSVCHPHPDKMATEHFYTDTFTEKIYLDTDTDKNECQRLRAITDITISCHFGDFVPPIGFIFTPKYPLTMSFISQWTCNWFMIDLLANIKCLLIGEYLSKYLDNWCEKTTLVTD